MKEIIKRYKIISQQPDSKDDNQKEIEEYKTLVDIYFDEIQFETEISNNIIYCTGDIQEGSSDFLMKRINLILKFRNNENIKTPITLILNSFGGDVYEALGIIDFIKGLSTPINIKCYTKAMSAAALILCSTTGLRSMSYHSTMMLHELSSDSFGKASDIKSNTNHIKELEHKLINILSSSSKKSHEYWKRKLNPDLYLTSKQALTLGLIDEIIE